MDLLALNADANEALDHARARAAERGLNTSNLTDILIALVDSQEAVRLIELFETEPDSVRAASAFLSQSDIWTDPDAEERTVDLARAEAARLGQSEAGPEHLVLALVRQLNSMPAGILESLGITLDSAREAVRYLHGLVPDWQPPANLNSLVALKSAPTEGSPGPISEEDAARRLDMSMTNFEVGMGALDRVIGIGQATEAAGILVELIALEIREGGGVLHWRTQTNADRVLGDADMAVSDDLGTTYQVLPGSWSGSDRESRGETRLVPKPLDAARTLIIDIRSFGRMDWIPFPSPLSPIRDEVTGSWRFEVSLAI